MNNCLLALCVMGATIVGGVTVASNVDHDPNSVYCHSNPCQNNGTCVNMLRPGSDRSLSVCGGERCYKVILEKKTWEEATISCGIMGASLVALEVQEEATIVSTFISNKKLYRTRSSIGNPGGFWSSGNDLREEGAWVWGATTGNPVTLWPLTGQSRTTNCLVLRTDTTLYSSFRWLVERCDQEFYYVCEMSVQALYQERTCQCLCEEGFSGPNCEQSSDHRLAHLCNDVTTDIACERGKRLNIIRASFQLATPDTNICPVSPSHVEPTSNCALTPNLNQYLHLQVLNPLCEGQERCTINITAAVLQNFDQCPYHQKYADVEYSCKDTYTVNTKVCETNTAHLSCEKTPGLPYVRVDMALYGRLRLLPKCGMHVASNCRSITSLDTVVNRCNGYESCNITASNSIFTDPCPGSYKHLDISYQCLANITEALAPYPIPYAIATLPPPVYCPALNHSGLSWRRTKKGHTDMQRCPDGQDGLAFWSCVTNSDELDSEADAVWSTAGPDLTQCVSAWINDIYEEIAGGTQPASQLAANFLNNTGTDEAIDERELQQSVSLLDDLVDLQRNQLNVLRSSGDVEETEATAEMFGEVLLGIGSNLLGTNNQDTWESIGKDSSGDGATAPSEETTPSTVTTNLENTGFLVAEFLHENTSSLTISSDNILMTVEAVPTNTAGKRVLLKDDRWTEDGGAVRHAMELPPSATKPGDTVNEETGQQDVPVQIVFLVYETLAPYLTDIAIGDIRTVSPLTDVDDFNTNGTNQTSSVVVLNSAVVSASARRDSLDIKKFSGEEEALLTLKHTRTNISGDVTCVFWNTSRSLGKHGAWSDTGCRLVTTNQSHTVCACNHLTNFAILMDYTGALTQIPSIHEKLLTSFTFIGSTISIVCLLMSLFAFTFFRNLWSLRVTIHRNLCLSLLLANILFLVGVDKTQIKVLCSVIAALLHYFFLAAFVWMSLEAIQFYILLVNVFSTHSKQAPYYLAGYGIPAIIVGVSAAIKRSDGYGTDKYCWLSSKDYFIWSFTGPVAVIITVNVVLLVVSLRIAYSSRSSITQNNDIRTWIKGATTLLFLLGITWGIGFFFINEQSLVFAYVFTILNSLQGLFIFIFYCLGNERVNSEFRKLISRQRWLPSIIKDRYGKKSAAISSMHNASVKRENKCRSLDTFSNITTLVEAADLAARCGRSCSNPVVNVEDVDAENGAGMAPTDRFTDGNSWLREEGSNAQAADSSESYRLRYKQGGFDELQDRTAYPDIDYD